eukprot:350259-Chlamydomonas_euryale.AAC.6
MGSLSDRWVGWAAPHRPQSCCAQLKGGKTPRGLGSWIDAVSRGPGEPPLASSHGAALLASLPLLAPTGQPF